MPRRSNEFQQLVKLIETQLASDRAVVRESVLLHDAEGDRREIDVLIETNIGQHDVRIAVECRDHRRRADKTWIEQLIGKYEGLPIHKVIAVSRRGFSRAALDKAARHKIAALSLEEAREENWLNAVYGHENAYVTTVRFVPIHVELFASGVSDPNDHTDFHDVYNGRRQLVGRIPYYFFHLLHARFEATKLLMQPLIDAFDSKSQSFNGGVSLATLDVPITSVLYLDPELQVPITGWRYTFNAQVERSSIRMERFSYNGAQIAAGRASALGAQLLMTLVSTQNDDPKIALSVSRDIGDGMTQKMDAYSHPVPDDGPVHYLVFAFG